MHPAPVFEWKERETMLAFVGERAFATVVGSVGEPTRVAVGQAPLLVDGDRLLLHLSRANPLAKNLPLRVTAIVSGLDAYVSPDWYAADDQVPTWNYVSVEITGELVATDDAMLLEILRRQSAVFEGRIAGKRPWTVDKLDPSTLAAKLKGIVGVTLSIEELRGTRKLSQNKTDADRAGVVEALAQSPRAADREIAVLMGGRRT